MTRVRSFMAALLILLCLPAWAGDIFISPEGEDSAAGTKDKPLKGLEAALAKAAPGDTLTLAKGDYEGPVRINVAGLTVRSAPGAMATIRSSPKAGYACVQVAADRVLLSGLEIVGGGMHAVDFNGTKQSTIQGCRCHDSVADVIKCSPASADITIKDCEIYNSGLEDGKPSSWNGNAEGIDNVRSDNMHVVGCYIHDTATNGAYAKGGAKNALFERCLFRRIGLNKGVQGQGVILGEHAGGTLTYESFNGTVRNCYFIDIAGAAFAAWCADKPSFYNNTAVNVARTDRAGVIVIENHGLPCRDLTMVNNVIMVEPKSPKAIVWIYRKGLEGKTRMDNNVYFGGSGKFQDWRESDKTHDLAGWQKAMGVDGKSVLADPKLDGNHHLSADSPCVGKGAKQDGLKDDYDGQPRKDKIDIGADQFFPDKPHLAVPPAKDVIGIGVLAPFSASAPGGDWAVPVQAVGRVNPHGTTRLGGKRNNSTGGYTCGCGSRVAAACGDLAPAYLPFPFSNTKPGSSFSI